MYLRVLALPKKPRDIKAESGGLRIRRKIEGQRKKKSDLKSKLRGHKLRGKDMS